jgi:hypothetical protein
LIDFSMLPARQIGHGRKISLAADDVSPGRGPPEIT